MGKIEILYRIPMASKPTSGTPRLPAPTRTIVIERPNHNKYTTDPDAGVVITPGKPPERCPVCYTPHSLVNSSETGFRYRCTLCGYKF